jgi:hypothetical protein
MRAIIHPPARLISLQEFSHKPGGQDMSDTPEIADQLATTTPAPGSMSGALGLRATVQWYRDNRPWWEPLKPPPRQPGLRPAARAASTQSAS